MQAVPTQTARQDYTRTRPQTRSITPRREAANLAEKPLAALEALLKPDNWPNVNTRASPSASPSTDDRDRLNASAASATSGSAANLTNVSDYSRQTLHPNDSRLDLRSDVANSSSERTDAERAAVEETMRLLNLSENEMAEFMLNQ